MRADLAGSRCRTHPEKFNAEDDTADRAITPQAKREEAGEYSCCDARV
jgi:hypothetical protein